MLQRNLHIAFGLLFGVLLLWSPMSFIQAKQFIVVIDAGHGGHDSGAIGQFSQEKDINLRVALAVGKLIESNCRDVDVVYTRKTDVFIPLDRRAEIANNAKADLFISIHTNSLGNSKTYTGASTWTLGLAKSEANLEVAKRENSVILYENDYKSRYAGFNPNSSESYIIFEFMQDKYMKESVHLASLVQSQFRSSLRPDRGVHQAGFLVLKASAMPSILIELGFISTPDEEKYLNSDDGLVTLSQDIYRAFTLYKRENDIRLKGSSITVVPPSVEKKVEQPVVADTVEPMPQASKERKKKVIAPQTTAPTVAAVSDSIVFKLQFMAIRSKLGDNDVRLKDMPNVECMEEDGYFKYFCAASADYNQVRRQKKDLDARYPNSFIVAYKNGTKINVNEAIRTFLKQRRK